MPSARPRLRDVAEATGISEAAVSMSLRGLPGVSEETRRRVVRVAGDLGYARNMAASTLAASRSGLIGVVVGDLHNPFFADLSDAISAVAEASDLRVLLGTGHYDRRRELDALETFRDLRADGVIIVGARIGAKTIEEIDAQVPVVAVACLPRASKLDRVVVNDRLGSRLATEHLIAAGHTDIAHIHGGTGAGGRERLAGFRDAMAAAGLPDDRIFGGAFTAEVGAKAAVELMNEPPTGVVACSDVVAWGAIAELTRHGIAVPDDISIVGYDNSSIAAPVGDFLTTIDGDRGALGRRAVELLLERLDGRTEPILEVIAPRLVTRDSTRSTSTQPMEAP
ncbi:MAG: LacI family DNA-binding transcriptional regulator [Acidimicrobiales bacterium]